MRGQAGSENADFKVRRSRSSFKPRTAISFRSVNQQGTAAYQPGMQRHHLLPLQLVGKSCFAKMFKIVSRKAVGFDDFRMNGMLLPSTDEATFRTGMPLHRGPHRRYNELVIERVGRIEARWSNMRKRDDEAALSEVLLRLALLQAALRNRLLHETKRMILNKKDPLGTGFNFTELDAMADAIWSSTD